MTLNIPTTQARTGREVICSYGKVTSWNHPGNVWLTRTVTTHIRVHTLTMEHMDFMKSVIKYFHWHFPANLY